MRKQFPADDGFERYRKPTRPDLFLAEYDSRATRRFVDIDLGRELAQDEATICKLRHLLHLDGMRVSGGSAYAGQGDIGDWTRTPTGCLWHVDWSIVYGATTVAATT